MAVVRFHLFISGRVQGVFYRRDARREAMRLGLTGWVRNLPDRRVEVMVEGEDVRVEEFIRWCWEGPAMAIVRGIEKIEESPTGEFEAFTVKR